MERTQKANKNWESYNSEEEEEDMDSVLGEEDVDVDVDMDNNNKKKEKEKEKDTALSPLKRFGAMAEDKLQEKRLKERARRNGMACSIDEMRLIVPELIEAKKNYSQAKVVAFALAHIYELQHENDDFRARLGLPTRMEEFRSRTKPSGKHKKDKAPAGERSRKRRRLSNGKTATVDDSATASLMNEATASASSPPSDGSPQPQSLPHVPDSVLAISVQDSAFNSATPEVSDHEMDLDSYVVDSLAASPALSPHAIDDELGPFGTRNFDNFDSHPRPHTMEWEGHDTDTDMFHQIYHNSNNQSHLFA
jgi:hypothetical protein